MDEENEIENEYETQSDQSKEQTSGKESHKDNGYEYQRSQRPQQPQQQYAPYQHPQQYQQRSLTDTFSSDSMLLWGILIGVILLVIGVLLNGIMFFVDSGDTIETLMGLALIFLQLGGVMFVLFLTMASLFKEKLGNYVKLGLMIAVALILYALLSFMGNWGYLFSRIGP
ncbi:MAG: hypothetical protein ACLFVB_03440 [Thermoplasmata archaeon]